MDRKTVLRVCAAERGGLASTCSGDTGLESALHTVVHEVGTGGKAGTELDQAQQICA